MKFYHNDNVNKLFVTEFLQKYLSLGFANLPKKEIDILVFGLITKYDYIDGKDYYSIANELMLDERRVRKYMMESALRNNQTETLKESIRTIHDDIFIKSKIIPEFFDEKIVILLENPIVKRDFIYALRCIGYSYDENLNPERISIPIYAFMAVFCKNYDDMYQKMKEITKERLKSDNNYNKAFQDGKPMLEKIKFALKAIAEPVSDLSALKLLLGIK